MPHTRAANHTQKNPREVCDGSGKQQQANVRLQVLDERGIRKSRSGRRRAIVLAIVHLLILAHVLHWLWTGRTISPIEPSEAKDLAMKGVVNAGLIFFVAAIVSTMILGRFFCGWGCHLIAYQDLTLWLLKKLHLRPRQFRSRLLIFVPLIAAFYMFFWPWVYRLWHGHHQPQLAVHLSTSGFWDTFPGLGVAILTVLVCGVAIIYFLGPKGFCTYACPYGGIFGTVDQIAPARIRVTDACHQCGHCTAVCSSNVDVAREVNLYGMVVDPGCMKCLDCVSVCPNDALYVGWGAPAIAARPRADAGSKPARKNDLIWPEELLAAIIFAGSFLAFRGLYGQIPFLMSLGVAGIFTFVIMKAVSSLYRPDAMLQKIRLKISGRMQPAGYGMLAIAVLLAAFTLHSGLWQYHAHRGHAAYMELPGEDLGWQHRHSIAASLAPNQRASLDRAMHHLSRAQSLGLVHTDHLDLEISWLHLLSGRHQEAVDTVQSVLARRPEDLSLLIKLGTYEVSGGRSDEARRAFQQALAVEKLERERIHRKRPTEPVPMSGLAWAEWGLYLASQNRPDDAREAMGRATSFDPESAALWHSTGLFELAAQQPDAARIALIKAVKLAPRFHAAQQTLESLAKLPQDFAIAVRQYDSAMADQPDILVFQYNRAYALTAIKRYDEAVKAYQEILRTRPQTLAARIDLGALHLAMGNLKSAVEQYEEVFRQAPNDPEMAMRLAVLYVQSNRAGEAVPLLRKAAEFGSPQQRATALDALRELETFSGGG